MATTVADTYDVWTEAAYEYVRDQLRSNGTVGLAGPERVKTIEVGAFDIRTVATSPDSLPQVWVVPNRDALARDGHFIRHSVTVEVTCLGSAPPVSTTEFAEAQKRHRQFAARVYNALLGLRDGGRTAGHWMTWDPVGEIIPFGADVGSQRYVLLATPIPFRFTRDRQWIDGA